MKAIVVDDSRAVRKVLSKMLREIGFDVREAPDGKAALDSLLLDPDVGLALVDWNMPVMTGIELVEALRKDARFQRVRLMMVTSEAELSQVSRAMAAGADEYVMKPFSRDVIEDKLRLLGLTQGAA